MNCNTQTQPDGYKLVRISLSNNGVKKSYIVARLIAQAFIPNPDNLPTVDHIDRNSTNNHVSNLRWASLHTQNLNHTYQIGVSGEKHIYKQRNRWCFKIRRHKQLVFYKYFPTLEEAIAARDGFLNSESHSE